VSARERLARAYIRLPQELTKRFKRNLKTEAAKNGFKELLKRFARVEGGKLYLR
jgi:hypothetical protein